MSMVSGVSKYKEEKLSTIEELEDYLDERYNEEDEVCLFSNNSQLWVSRWFRNKYKDLESGNGDYKILSKEIIEEFVEHCNEILNNGYNEFYDRACFESNEDDEEQLLDEVQIEICETRDRFEELLKQDFENNTLIYWETYGI